MSDSWLAEHRVERVRILERENEYLRGERIRLERLLGRALQVAVSGTQVSESALLDVLCDLEGTSSARPAFMEHRARLEDPVEKAVRVLQETG